MNRRTRTVLLLLMVVGAIAALFLFWMAILPRFEGEIVETLAKDEHIRAELLVGSAGATTSTTYFVTVFLDGDKDPGEKILTADKVRSFSMAWADDGRLDLCFEDARIHHFSNFTLALVDDEIREVRIRLDTREPCG